MGGKRVIPIIIILIVLSSSCGAVPLFVEKQPETVMPVLKDPMDSPWPMYCHDVRHTGRSPYSTANNPGIEKWRVRPFGYFGYFAPIIDNDDIIYVHRGDLYALYPNGVIKWQTDLPYNSESTPAIDEHGIIYTSFTGGPPTYLYAIYSNNGSMKWRYRCNGDIDSSPAIGPDGVVYFGDWDGIFHAVNPNGTCKWTYFTGDVITSSPAIGHDGTIFVGSHDNHVYAFYPNGIVKWKYDTGKWVHSSPSIGADGTVYIGDDGTYLTAFNPTEGSVKWRVEVGSMWCSPAIDNQGVLYFGVWEKKFYAVYPNGTIKWTYNAPGRIWFGNSATLSAEGTIYFCTTAMDGGQGAFIALNSNGTERFKVLSNDFLYESSPAIGSDDTIYVGSWNQPSNIGYLSAFGKLDPRAPSAPSITGPTEGYVGEEHEYILLSYDPINKDIYYQIDWGDGETEDLIGPFASGEKITLKHTWIYYDTYIIRARTQNTNNFLSDWTTLEVTMPKDKFMDKNYYDIQQEVAIVGGMQRYVNKGPASKSMRNIDAIISIRKHPGNQKHKETWKIEGKSFLSILSRRAISLSSSDLNRLNPSMIWSFRKWCSLLI